MKSRARRTILVAFTSFAASVGAAGATDRVDVERGSQSRLVRSITIPVTVDGSVQVEFTSSLATGCERRCDLSGSLTWNPTGRADMAVSEYRRRGNRELEASLFFFGGLGQDAPRTTAHVVRGQAARPGVCSDARVNALTFLDFSAGSGSYVQARLINGEQDDANLFRSRCGGPLERDLVTAMPSATLNRALLMRGRTTVDLSSATRPFAAHGFAGTVRSSVKLRLGQAREEPPERELASPREPPASAPRTVIAVYDVEEVSGSIVTAFTGGTERSLCDPLDACGTAGTVRLSPFVSAGRATFVAYGPARRVSGRDLRAALGLRPGRLAPGINASGVANWSRDGGSVVESFTGSDGTTCSDTVPLAGGFMTFYVGPRRVFASYGRASGAGPDLLRTHCPGPSILDAAQNSPLASGNVSRRQFRKRRVLITLSRGRPFESEPYAGESRPALKIVLRRVRVRETLSFDALGGL
jgi:hypothetical protein